MFYFHRDAAYMQCSGYTGLHFHFGSWAFGWMPKNWKDAGGLSVFIKAFTPSRQYLPPLNVRWHPRGGPNSPEAKRRRAARMGSAA